ncbi:MAG: hypothetical protein KF845_04955 [Cyclobacteriaceae bacterium]|nr:hypothetical protein [Cyclobacteriaceae bacterium]
MKGLIMGLMLLVSLCGYAQRITGTWQVSRQANCLSVELDEISETEEELLEEMASRSGNAPKTFVFNNDGSGTGNWRTYGKRKPASKEKFLYRYSDGMLYLLDKKSRLITGTYIVENITASTLVIINKDRTCERTEFARIN